MSLLGKVFSGVAYLIKDAWNPLSNLGRNLILDAILPKIKTPDIGQAGTVYTFDPGNGTPSPGDPMPLMFGAPKIAPLVLSKRKEYVGKNEVTYLELCICDGPAVCKELLSGSVALTTIGGIEIQELQPGEPPGLFDVDYWTNPDIGGNELQGGSLDLHPYNANVTFDSSGSITINSDDEPFDDMLPGGRISVNDSPLNSGEYIIATVTDSQHATVTGTLVNETVDCTVNVFEVVTGGASVWAHSIVYAEGEDEDDPDDIMLAFDNGDGARGTITGDDPTVFNEFRVGDLVQSYRTASNDNVDRKVLAISGATMVVEPAPVTEAANLCALVMVRRQFGGYAACPQGTKTDRIGVNILFNSGLYRTNDKGKLRTATTGMEVQIQEIDDSGNALADIISLGERSFSGRDRTPQRYTVWYDVPPARYQVFVARTSPADDDSGRSDAMTLGSICGHIVSDGTIPEAETRCTRMLLKITASSALANGEDSRITGIWQAMHPLFVDGEWTEPQATSDIAPAWAAVRRLRGFAVDTDEYLAAHAYWQALGWEYHAWLTGSGTLKSATAEILAIGDARPWYDWRRNVDTIWRDRLRDDPALMIDDNSRDRGSMQSMPIGLVSEDSPTGVEATYTDPRTGEKRVLYIGDQSAPAPIEYKGVQSRQQAWELGNRDAARLRLRRVPFDVGLQWLHTRLNLGDAVMQQSYEHQMGQYSELASFAGSTLIVDREIEWHPTLQHQAWLRATDGTFEGPIDCAQGSDARTVVLDSAPVTAMDLGDDGNDRTHVLIGYPGHAPLQALFLGAGASEGFTIATANMVIDEPSIFDNPGEAPDDKYPIEGEPADLTIDDFVLTVDGLTLIGTWTEPAPQIAAQMEYQLTGASSWTPLPLVVGGSSSADVTQGGTYRGRVRAFGPAGSIGVASNIDTASITAPALSVALSPTTLPPVVGSSDSMLSATVTPVIYGGTGPFTGTWVKDAGDAGVTWSSASGPTQFKPGFLAEGNSKYGTFHYHVVDSLSIAADSPSITAYFERPTGSGPIP
jgi:hypothetical protein